MFMKKRLIKTFLSYFLSHGTLKISYRYVGKGVGVIFKVFPIAVKSGINHENVLSAQVSNEPKSNTLLHFWF